LNIVFVIPGVNAVGKYRDSSHQKKREAGLRNAADWTGSRKTSCFVAHHGSLHTFITWHFLLVLLLSAESFLGSVQEELPLMTLGW
jgi:hypothetical protein